MIQEDKTMKTLRSMLFIALLSVSSLAFAQSAQPAQNGQSDAQKSFTMLKTLAGTWKGKITTDMPQAKAALDDKPMYVTFRVTSRGNALVHEMKEPGTPDDPTKDDPITMFYVDGDRLLLTHYCDAGNRPRMTGKMSADGKSVEFEFLDIAGNTKYGHMHHGAFTIIDANHHTEDWTFMMGDKPVHAHFDLQRTN
jgi:hypothetical protein